MTLEQSLSSLLAEHGLNHFTICTTHDGRFYAFAQWGEGESHESVMGSFFATIADALTDVITKANAKRAIAPNVILPGAPLLVEVEA